MYDRIIGALLISSWLNSMLFMLEITQTWKYFSSFPNDGMVLKVTVGTCFVLDLVCTIANHIGVYKYCITNWGVVEYLSQQEWQIPLYLMCTGLVAAVVQTFLTRRLYQLQKSIVITVGIALLILASLAGSFATAIMIIYSSDIKTRAALKIPVIIWFVVSSVVDCGIAALLIWYLQTSRTGFKSTHGLINRLSSLAVQTGATTSAVALLTMIIYLNDPSGNGGTACGQLLGRIYTLTLLYNLNSRASIRSDSTRGGTSRGGESGAVETLNLSGIHVHRTAVVHMDDAPSSFPRQDSRSKKTNKSDDGDSLSGQDKSIPIA